MTELAEEQIHPVRLGCAIPSDVALLGCDIQIPLTPNGTTLLDFYRWLKGIGDDSDHSILRAFPAQTSHPVDPYTAFPLPQPQRLQWW